MSDSNMGTPTSLEEVKVRVEGSDGFPRSRHWRNLRNVLRAISLLKHFDLEEQDIEELMADIRRIPSDQEYRQQKKQRKENSAAYVAISDLRREGRFFSAIERGGPEDLKTMGKELDEDPYRLLRDPSHPLSLLNKRNHSLQTPLYVACKNGHMNAVSFLLSRGADPLIYSEVAGQQETNLMVAARWGHFHVVQTLLQSATWSKAAISTAHGVSQSKTIKYLLKPKRKTKGCCF